MMRALRRLTTFLALLGLSVLAACGVEFAPMPEDGARAPAPLPTNAALGGGRGSRGPSRSDRY